MADLLDLEPATTDSAAPDPWPESRARHPGQPIVRRIYVDALEQEWVIPQGEAAMLFDGATQFVYTPARKDSPTAAEQAELIEQFNRLWNERPGSHPSRERRA